MSIEEIIQSNSPCPSNTIKVLEANSELVRFKKKASLIEQGEISPSVFLIKEGICAIVYGSKKEGASKDTVLFGAAGDIALSPTGFMFNLPAVFSIMAVTNVKAYKIEGSVIRNLYKTDPAFCRWIAEISMTQLAQLEIRYTYMAPKDAYERFLNLIRFKPKSFLRSVPDYQIASYLGVTPTTLSLLRARWAKDKECKATYDRDFLASVGLTNTGIDCN